MAGRTAVSGTARQLDDLGGWDDSHEQERLVSHQLENGLRVVVLPRPGSPVICCRLFAMAGSRHDDDVRGRAHLTEHCLASAARLGGDSVEAALEQVGAELEAGTQRDLMHFGVTASPDHLELGLQALAAIVEAPLSDDVLLQRQQAIIAHEMEQYRDGIGPLWDALFSAVWEDHPFVPPAIGGPELFRLSSTELAAGLLQPQRAVLTAVGGLDPAALMELAGRQLGGWGAEAVPSPAPGELGAPRPRQRPQWRHLEADLQHSYFILGWPAPAIGSQDDAALAALARILGDGARSLLSRELRDRRGEVYDVQATLLQFRDAGMLAVWGDCANQRVAAVLGRISQLLAGPQGPPIGAQDLLHCQRSFRTSLARTYETAGSRATLLGSQALWGIRRTLSELAQAVEQLSLEELSSCAQRYLVGRAPAMAVLGPSAAAGAQ